jgi:signal transduction histidine kinase
MIETENQKTEQTALIRNCMIYAVSWTIICVFATCWNYLEIKDESLDFARQEARTMLDKNQSVPSAAIPEQGSGRGGTSISAPLAPYQELEARSLRTLYFTHLFFWAAGLFILGLSFHRNKKRLINRLAAEDLLREQSEKIQLFAYSVAHDLKNPVIAIHGLAKLLNKRHLDSLDEKSRQYCAQIEKSAEQVSTLVDQINAFISSKEQPIKIEPLNLLEICHTVQAENDHRLREKGVHWCEPGQTGTLDADRLIILRILRNLVDNALKYGGETLSKITITGEESAKFHTIRVANDGKPLAPDDCRRIFQRYKRNCSDNKVEGTGLGLAIVRELVGLHGGRVWVESDGRRGVTFSFTIAKTDKSAKAAKDRLPRLGRSPKPS